MWPLASHRLWCVQSLARSFACLGAGGQIAPFGEPGSFNSNDRNQPEHRDATGNLAGTSLARWRTIGAADTGANRFASAVPSRALSDRPLNAPGSYEAVCASRPPQEVEGRGGPAHRLARNHVEGAVKASIFYG